MGRTIPSFRIATILEEQKWKSYRSNLKKQDRKIFSQMFSIPTLYNVACTLVLKPIRIHPILMSIMLYNYTILNEKRKNSNQNNIDKDTMNLTLDRFFNQNYNNMLLEKEIESWQKFSIGLRKNNRDLFNKMLQSCYKYSPSIKEMGNERITESLFMTILFEQYKQFRMYESISQ